MNTSNKQTRPGSNRQNAKKSPELALAAVLGEHFKGEAAFQAIPESTSNCLLINASQATFDEVIKVLEQLDRRPRTVSVEVLVAEVATPKADGDKPKDDGDKADAADTKLDDKEFTGSMSEVVAKVEALRRKGAIGAVRQVQLTALEGQPASVFLGEQKAFTMALNVTARGTTSRSITYHNTGIRVDLTVRVSPDKTATVDLKLEDSKAHIPDDGVSIGVDENGAPVRAAEFITTTLSDKLSIPSGQAVTAHGMKTSSKSEKSRTIVIVGARLVEPDAKPEK